MHFTTSGFIAISS